LSFYEPSPHSLALRDGHFLPNGAFLRLTLQAPRSHHGRDVSLDASLSRSSRSGPSWPLCPCSAITNWPLSSLFKLISPFFRQEKGTPSSLRISPFPLSQSLVSTALFVGIPLRIDEEESVTCAIPFRRPAPLLGKEHLSLAPGLVGDRPFGEVGRSLPFYPFPPALCEDNPLLRTFCSDTHPFRLKQSIKHFPSDSFPPLGGKNLSLQYAAFLLGKRTPDLRVFPPEDKFPPTRWCLYLNASPMWYSSKLFPFRWLPSLFSLHSLGPITPIEQKP